MTASFPFDLICFPTLLLLSLSFPPQNSDPLSVARQQLVIINAAVCVGYLEVVPHIGTKRSRGMWMKWTKNSRVEIGFGVGVWMVFQGSLPHMLSAVARRMLQMNEIKECVINETTAWPDVSLLNISPLLIFSWVFLFMKCGDSIQVFFHGPSYTHKHTHTHKHCFTGNEQVALRLGPVFHSADFLLL